MESVAIDKYRQEFPDYFSRDVCKIIEKMWHDDPKKRPRFEEALVFFEKLLPSDKKGGK